VGAAPGRRGGGGATERGGGAWRSPARWGWFRAAWEEEKQALDSAEQAARYLCAAGDGDGAWEPARQVILALRHVGRYREALGWAERTLDAGASGERRGEALAFRGQLGRRSGALPANPEQQLREAAELVTLEDRSFVLDELASLLHHQGRLQEAAALFAQSIAVEIGVKGEEHPDVAASLHELAGVLQAQGDLAGAREHLERSLRIHAKVFGTEEHPSVAASLHSLAGVLQAQGDLAGAREHLERVLAISERVYRTREHYLTAITETSLGALLLQLGEPRRAVDLLAHAYRVFLTQLGPSHPYTQQLAELFDHEPPSGPPSE
jgi:tetratricopeptide (TPR) repeat protein